MKNTKWTLIILLIAVGLGLEALRNMQTPNGSNELQQVLSESEFKPFAKSKSMRALQQQRSAKHVSRNSTTRPTPSNSLDTLNPPQTAASGQMDLGAPPESKKQSDKAAKKEDDENKVSDENPCAEDDLECQEALARKQAEDKEKEKANQEKLAKKDRNKEAKHDNDDSVAERGPVTGPGGQAGPAPEEVSEEEEDELITFWVNRLLVRPDYKLANELAGLRQSKQVSTVIYFAVIDELITDPREGIQVLATYLLASYQSAESFEKLIAISREATFGSRLNQQTETYIKAYQKINNLKHLTAVLGSSTDLSVLKKAIQLVENSAKSRLNEGVNTAENEASTLDANSAKFYRGFIGLLEEIAQSINDSETASLASSTLSSLQDLLPQEEPTVASNP